MKKPNLNKILDLIVNEEFDKARPQINKWLNARMFEISEEMDKNDIEDNLDSIKAEEEHSISEKEETVDDMADQEASEEVEDGDLDLDITPEPEAVNPENASSIAKEDLDPNEVNYQFTDIQRDLERLKKEFDKINGSSEEVTEDDLSTDITGTDDVDSDDEEPGELSEDADSDEKIRQEGSKAFHNGEYRDSNPYEKNTREYDLWKEGFDDTKDLDESKEFTHDMDSGAYDEGANAADRGLKHSDNPYKKGTTEYKSWIEGFDKKDDELDESFLTQADIDKLIEACDITFPVDIDASKDGQLAGNGEKITPNDKSAIPGNKDSKDRSKSAKPIEIKSEDDDSFSLETPPKSEEVKLGKVMNRPNVNKVPKDGDPKAELNNKADGFGSDHAESPISGKQAKGK